MKNVKSEVMGKSEMEGELKIRKIKTIIHFDYTPHNARNKYHKEIKEYVIIAKDLEGINQQIDKIKSDLESRYLDVYESMRVNDYYAGWEQ